jgi:hypothetical protein
MLIATFAWPMFMVGAAYVEYTGVMHGATATGSGDFAVISYPDGMLMLSRQQILGHAITRALIIGTTAWVLVMAFLGAVRFATRP